MRWLLALLICAPFSLALVVGSSAEIGSDPVLYGDLIAYERDGNVHVYDVARKQDFDVGNGTNPSIFGFVVAFESNKTIWFANVRDKSVVDTQSVGSEPYVFSDVIVFSTKESDLGVDFSNDGDLDDWILRQYDIKSEELVNLKAVGSHPVFNQRAIVFLTDESAVSADLNLDGDKSDVILRLLDRQSRQVANLKVESTPASLSRLGIAVFESGGTIRVMDVKDQMVVDTKLKGQHPVLFDNVVVFERNGELFGYSLEDDVFAKIQLSGSAPALFDDLLVVVSSEDDLGDLNGNGILGERVIRYAREEDADGDDVSDFVDNCPALAGEQLDSDGDGVGDGCANMAQNESLYVAPMSNVTSSVPGQDKIYSGVGWYWVLLLLIPFLPALWKFGRKYYRRRQKSFGF